MRTASGPAGDIALLPIAQVHGHIASLGFRIGHLAYCNDLNELPEASIAALRGVEIFIVDALRHTPHPSHATVTQAIEWAREIGAKRTVLTNMHVDLDYQSLLQTLPADVEPGYDGQVIETCLKPC